MFFDTPSLLWLVRMLITVATNINRMVTYVLDTVLVTFMCPFSFAVNSLMAFFNQHFTDEETEPVLLSPSLSIKSALPFPSG